MKLFLRAAAFIALATSPTSADPFTQLAEATREGFSVADYQIRKNVERDASIAALAAIPEGPRGFSIGFGASFVERHDVPAGAAGLSYRNGRVSVRAGVAFPEVVGVVGFSVRLGE